MVRVCMGLDNKGNFGRLATGGGDIFKDGILAARDTGIDERIVFP